MEQRVDGILFYASYYDAISDLPEEDQGRLYVATMRYIFEGIEPTLSGVASTAFKLMRPTIDANIKRRINGKKGAEFGKLGGRPKEGETPSITPKVTPPITPKVTPSITPKKNKEKEKENINNKNSEVENKKSAGAEVRPQDVVDLFNEVCVSLPKVRTLTKERVAHIKARLKDNEPRVFRQVFEKVEASDFLTGRNGRWTACNFDWVVGSAQHWVRILEGTYDNEDHVDRVENLAESLINSASPEAVREFEESMNGGYRT